ncbi:MAG: hypothetical protein GXO30_05480, partial [Epsilonproteobacteria bacterium]|nr:hypothetical protein [Campylobacterota bacterium]
NTIFKLSLDSKEFKTYYLKVQNKTTSLKFGLFLKEEVVFLYDEYTKRSLMDVFFTIIIMLLMYNLTLLFYTKNKTYFLYAFYLATLISQQATYLGLTQLYMPSWFVYYDDLSVVFKVNMVFIAAAFFAKSFLETKNYPKINTIYNIIISAGFLEIFLLGMPSFYYPEIGIVTAFSFVIFNMYAGFYVYISGYKQARFFVVGWSFLVIGFIVMIFDSLGIITVMHKVSNIIMFLTAFEAVVLSLAFLDRYMILKQEKEQINKILLNTLNEKQIEIELQINKKTKDLCDALENKKILLKELQHRTKNNLQLILSLIRMQSDGSSEGVKHKFKNLEGRISAIAKSHQLLYLKDDLQKINMDEYINELCNDLENLSEKELIIDIQARQIYMPLREASYIGLIINELITNSIKYVNLTNIIISIDMLKNGAKYLLIVKDNGNGFEYDKLSSEGIGLKLVQILVESQLGGNLEIQIKDGCRYMIEFQL